MIMQRDGADWIKTGDIAVRDRDGYYRFVGRNDDLIKSGGYRIGRRRSKSPSSSSPRSPRPPSWVSPSDAARGEIVKAFVTLASGVAPSEGLVRRIQQHVRESLAAYKYPRVVEFVDALPTTTTGKLDRRPLRGQEQARRGEGERRGR